MRKRMTAILVVILLFVSNCASPPPTTPPTIQTPTAIVTPQSASTIAIQLPTSAPPLPSATPDAVLILVEGEVNLKQVITGQTVLVSFGDYLWRGDVIVAGQEAQAEAMCSDGTSIQLDSNQSLTVTCGETPDPVYQDIILHIHQGQIEAQPSPRNPLPDHPVILSPRNTNIAEERPTIRWRAVEGAEEYEVVVRKRDSELWKIMTREPELPYPKTEPALETGIDYLIKVTAQMGPAGQSRPSESVWVTVFSTAEMEQVSQVKTQLEALDLSEESARFLVAAYYADQELYDAAITELVSLAEAPLSPLIQRLLGDVYMAIELDNEAEQSYREALRLAQAQGNQPVEAEAEVGLGHAAYATGDFEAALSHYEMALRLYQELDLESNVEAMQKFITRSK